MLDAFNELGGFIWVFVCANTSTSKVAKPTKDCDNFIVWFIEFISQNSQIILGMILEFVISLLSVSTGLQISRQVSESLIRRYGGRGSKLSLDDFLLSYCKVINLYGMLFLYQLFNLLLICYDTDLKIQILLKRFPDFRVSSLIRAAGWRQER